MQQENYKLGNDGRKTGFLFLEDSKNLEKTQQGDQQILQYINESSIGDKILMIPFNRKSSMDQFRQISDFECIGQQNTQNILSSDRLDSAQPILIGVDKIMQEELTNAFCSIQQIPQILNEQQQKAYFQNSIELTTNYLRNKYKKERILIFNWSVYHPGEVEKAFYEDPNVLVMSIHRYDSGKFYPGSGDPVKIGGQNALYKNINVGWNVDVFKVLPTFDDYVYAFNRVLGPIIKEFKPEFIIIHGTQNSNDRDKLEDVKISSQIYQYIIQKLKQIQPKILIIQESGKNIQNTSENAFIMIKQLAEQQLYEESNINDLSIKPNLCGISAVTSAFDKHKAFWKSLESKELLDYQRQFLGINCDFISGGHIQSFKINGDKITKITKKPELDFYNSLNDSNNQYYEENQKLLKFVPKCFSVNFEELSVTLENLIFGLENASILDLKIGYKTYDPKGNPLKREKAVRTAHQCQQIKMGFRVAGVKIKNQQGEIIYDKNGTQADAAITNHDLMKEIIIKVFKSNGQENINQNALQATIKFISELIQVIEQSERMFRSTSILILVDNIAQKYQIKWIDFNYVMQLSEDVENPNEKHDTNVSGGLKYLLDLLNTIE